MAIMKVVKKINQYKYEETEKLWGVSYAVNKEHVNDIYVVNTKITQNKYCYTISPVLTKYGEYDSYNKLFTKNELLDNFHVFTVTTEEEAKEFLKKLIEA